MIQLIQVTFIFFFMLLSTSFNKYVLPIYISSLKLNALLYIYFESILIIFHIAKTKLNL